MLKQKLSIIVNHLNYGAIFIGLLACLVTILVFNYLDPLGSAVNYQFSANKVSGNITKISGIESIRLPASGIFGHFFSTTQQVIRQDVVTFQVKLATAKINGIWIKLQFKGNSKAIQIGVRGSTSGKYSYTALYNQELESLTWNHITSSNTMLWQKNPIFSVLDVFAYDPPKGKTIATYSLNATNFFMNTGGTGTGKVTVTSTLRGSTTFYVAVTHTPFILDITKQDANAYPGPDVLSIQVYQGKQMVTQNVIPDDGNTTADKIMGKLQKQEIRFDAPKLGVYKVILKDNSNGSDIRITNITVNQPKLVFASPVFPAGATSTTLVTNSRGVQVSTPHPKSTQSVQLDGNFNLDITKENQNFSFNLDEPTTGSADVRGLHTLVMPKSDLKVSGDGVFAFSATAFFNPFSVKTVDISKLPDINQADYVLANYTPVTKDGDWLDAQVFIDPKNIKINGNTLYFSLESPGLASSGGEITINSLQITTTKPSWFTQPSVLTNPTTVKKSLWQRFTSWLSAFING